MKKIVLICFTLMLGACGVSSSNDGVVAREDNTGGFLGMSTKDSVEVVGGDQLSSIQNVVIGSFKVGFAESAALKKEAKGTFFTSATGGKATGNVKLEGIDEATKIAITNAAYSDFTNKLRSSGYNIVERDVLTSSKNYQSATKTKFPYKADDSGFLSSYGVTHYFQPTSLGSEGIILMMDIPSKGGLGFSALSAPDNKMVEFAKEKGIAVVSATYFVDFSAAGGHESVMSASIEVGQNIAVTQGKIAFVKDYTSTFNNGTPTVSLGQPIQSSEMYGQIADETSTANVALQETANVLGVLMGAGTNRSRDYVIEADPAKYQDIAVNVLTQANTALLDSAAK